MKLIDKDAVVAEINRRINNLEKLGNRLYIETNFPEQYRLIHGYESILSFLDTLEVKEVDLEKELQSFFYPHVSWGDYCKNEQKDIEEWSFKIAKHFFELGIKAQKGEEI
jgi:hypothetical protein